MEGQSFEGLGLPESQSLPLSQGSFQELWEK